MKKLFKKITASILLVSILLSTGTIVLAAPGLQEDSEATITTTVAARTNKIGVVSEVFQFETAKVSLDGLTTQTDLDKMPALSETATFSGADAWSGTPTVIAGNEYDGWYTVTKQVNLLDGVTFTSAGVYEYTLKETTGTNTDINYSGTEYIFRVYVKEDSGLKVTAVTFHEVITDEGTGDVTYVKSDPIFYNGYEPQETFSMKKEVRGIGASQSTQFDFTFTLHSLNSKDTNTYVGYIKRADGSFEKATVTAGTAATIKLAHNDELYFDGTPQDFGTGNESTDQLPLGIKYTMLETGVTGYTPSADVTIGNLLITPPATAATGNDLVVGQNGAGHAAAELNEPIEIEVGINKIVWQNAYIEVSPTGVIMNNLPFILLIIIAIGGFAGYIALKRRKATR